VTCALIIYKLTMATASPLDCFFNRYRAILLSESAPMADSECRLAGPTLIRSTNQGGYPFMKVRIPGTSKSKSVTISRLMYMCSVRQIDLEGDVSHLCHRKQCLNIQHLVLESRAVNNRRQTCYAQGSCTKLHEPFCIFP